jgi:hypothetical protein
MLLKIVHCVPSISKALVHSLKLIHSLMRLSQRKIWLRFSQFYPVYPLFLEDKLNILSILHTPQVWVTTGNYPIRFQVWSRRFIEREANQSNFYWHKNWWSKCGDCLFPLLICSSQPLVPIVCNNYAHGIRSSLQFWYLHRHWVNTILKL